MSISSDHWSRALALMDTAVTLRPDERDVWLARIADDAPEVAPLLRKLLSARQRVETNDILATLPRLDRQTQHPPNGEIGAHVGPFELIEALGHGGMGSVWRARYIDGRMKRDVAVKLPATSDNPAALAALRERFSRERDFLAQLEHPNIARLYDTGITESGQPYLAMEYVAGEPIDAYCDRHRLTIKARLTLYLQVLDAVEFAHRQLVLHRDLKPGNVLVDDKGQVRLLDFGVAKLLPEARGPSTPSAGTDLTELAGAAITLAYAAPEQINHGRLSTATDVYALGVMLYRLLTGSAPYQPKRDTRGALEEAVLIDEPALASVRPINDDQLASRQITASSLRKTLRGDIDTLLGTALKKRPEERYPTAAALAEDIRRHLQLQPIRAHADSLLYRVTRFAARNKTAVVGASLAAAALAGFSGVALWQAKLATSHAAVASKETARAATAQRFLATLFTGVDPEHNRAGSVSAVESLDRSAAAAERELTHEPETHALVLAQIADIYRRMGENDKVVATQRRRLDALQMSPKVDVNALIDAKLALGRALNDSQHEADNKGALPLLSAAYDHAVKSAANAERRVWALCLMAEAHRADRNFLPARSFADRALTMALAELPNPSRFLAEAYEVNASVASDERRTEDARRYFDLAINIDETGLGRGPVDRTMTLNYLAQLNAVDGRYGAALSGAERALGLMKSNFGEIKSIYAETLRTAILSALRGGNIDAAKRWAGAPLDAEIASGDAKRAALAHITRARVALFESDFVRARNDVDAAAPGLAKDAIWMDRSNVLRAELMLRSGDPAGAVSAAQALLQTQSKRFGPKHVNLMNTYLWLGVAEARLGKFDLAREHVDQSCAIIQAIRAGNPVRVRCEAYQVLLATGQTSGAKVAALDALATRLNSDEDRTLPIATSLRLARAYVVAIAQGSRPAAQFPILE